MTITIHDFEQGSDEWLAARCGMLTASEMKLIITPTLKIASNEKERQHLYELIAQRITRYVEPHYIGDDMLRGMEDEIEARLLYAKHFNTVKEVGFITNDKWGFKIGYSPDGLVRDLGQIEVKSRRQKYQVEHIIENVVLGKCHADFVIQVQTGLLVSERSWCDFISYSGGMPMTVTAIYPDPVIQDAILAAAGEFERRAAIKTQVYAELLESKTMRFVPTIRRVEQEIVL